MQYVEATLFVADLDGNKYRTCSTAAAAFKNKVSGDGIFVDVSRFFYEQMESDGHVLIFADEDNSNEVTSIMTHYIEKFTVHVTPISKDEYTNFKENNRAGL